MPKALHKSINSVNEATASGVLWQFCNVLFIISPQNIKFPITKEETAMIKDLFVFRQITLFPQIAGCLDSTHCAIICPNSKIKPIVKPTNLKENQLTQATLSNFLM